MKNNSIKNFVISFILLGAISFMHIYAASNTLKPFTDDNIFQQKNRLKFSTLKWDLGFHSTILDAALNRHLLIDIYNPNDQPITIDKSVGSGPEISIHFTNKTIPANGKIHATVSIKLPEKGIFKRSIAIKANKQIYRFSVNAFVVLDKKELADNYYEVYIDKHNTYKGKVDGIYFKGGIMWSDNASDPFYVGEFNKKNEKEGEGFLLSDSYLFVGRFESNEPYEGQGYAIIDLYGKKYYDFEIMIAGNIATFIVSEEDLSDKDKKLIEEMEMEVARIAEIHNIKADSFY